MINSAFNNLTLDALKNIRFDFGLRSVLDFLIVVALIYFLIILFKKTKSTPIITGLFLLVLVYAVSVFLNLPLTQTILKSFFGFFLVILAIIFQKELRRFFEFFGVLGMKRKILSPTEQNIKAIVCAAKSFVNRKIGAIMVFCGRENADRFFEGGYSLNGKLSEVLLLSIFDPSSPGHDGAVVIDGDKVRKFAVHLPLAEGVEAAKKYGTRHRAALGLAEATDALCVVISEERGTISIAHDKNIFVITSADGLEKVLAGFFKDHSPRKTMEDYKKWAKENITPVAVSIIATSLVWFFFLSQTTLTQKKFAVPLEFKNIPQNYTIGDTPEEVLITLSGRNSDFELLNPKDLVVSIDASSIKPGWNRILIEKENIKRPPNMSIAKIDPQNIRVQIIGLSK